VLGGFPDAGGTWTSPGGNPQPPTFTPGVSLPGCYGQVYETTTKRNTTDKRTSFQEGFKQLQYCGD